MILLAPYGSRGDVQPIAALGRELAGRGHEVVLCAPPDLAPIAAQAGLRFVPVGPPQSHLFDGRQSNLATFQAALSVAPLQLDVLLPLAREASVIVGAALQFAAPAIAEKLAIPYVYVMLSPIYLRSAELSPMGAPRGPFGRALHRVRLAIEDARQLRSAGWLLSIRRRWNQSPIRSLERYLTRSGTILLASDPVLAPPPREEAGVLQTGHLYLDAPAELPAEVEAFLAASTPPVFIGFGSMRHKESERFADALLEGLRRVGRRAIVHEAIVRLASRFAPTADIFVTSDLPHAPLFPRMAVCVHHGGHGTTIEAARAGVPQVIVPHLGDQFHHGKRVAELGIGPEPISLAKLTPSRFARALEFALDSTTAAAARDFGVGLRAREGTVRAADEIERILAGAAAGRR